MLGDPFHRGPLWKQTLKLVETVYRLATLFPDEEKSGLTGTLKRTVTSLPTKVAAAYAQPDDEGFVKAMQGVDSVLQEVDALLVVATKLHMTSPRRLRRVRKHCLELAEWVAAERAEAQAAPEPSDQRETAPALKLRRAA